MSELPSLYPERPHFAVADATDEELRQLICDATKLLGLPHGHDYAAKAIETFVEALRMKAVERLERTSQ